MNAPVDVRPRPSAMLLGTETAGALQLLRQHESLFGRESARRAQRLLREIDGCVPGAKRRVLHSPSSGPTPDFALRRRIRIPSPEF
jgi:hypothetical protein